MKSKSIHTYTIGEQQKAVLRTLLLLSTFILSVFVYKNLAIESYALAYIELALMCVSIWIFFYTKTLSNYKIFINITLTIFIILYVFLLYVVARPNTVTTNFLWFFVIPCASYAVLSKKLGFIVTLIFSVTAVVMYQYQIMISDHKHADEFAVYNISGSLALIWYIAHVYERGTFRSIRKLEASSTEDELTQLYNRKALTDIYTKHKNDENLTNIIIDIDFFKKINDTYGHDGGDHALIFFAKQLKQHFDDVGYIVRMGGEEFCIIIPDMPISKAVSLCESFLEHIHNTSFVYDNQSVSLTFSAGIATCPEDGFTYEQLLKIADQRLYTAKQTGRNRIVSS